MSECPECPECEPGLPAWMATFSDLMSLLMVFFVLLLSFSEMDVLKFKRLAGEMRNAFGVQREVVANDIPTGTSIIAQNFSPGTPDPTILDTVRQQTTDEARQYLRVDPAAAADARDKSKKLEEALAEEIREGLLEISTIDDQVIVSIREKGSFSSASAAVSTEFRAVLHKISAALNETEGKILVVGHTDNVPIQTSEYRSNWTLSAARAGAVTNTLTEENGVDPARVEIRAYAENRPLESNDTEEGRAKNRRVEIVVLGTSGSAPQLDNPDALEANPTQDGTTTLKDQDDQETKRRQEQ